MVIGRLPMAKPSEGLQGLQPTAPLRGRKENFGGFLAAALAAGLVVSDSVRGAGWAFTLVWRNDRFMVCFTSSMYVLFRLWRVVDKRARGPSRKAYEEVVLLEG